MSYKNFVPQVWAEGILRDRDDVIVAAKLCNRDYEGKIKDVGDRVKINGVSRPNVFDYDDETGLQEMEKLADQSTMLEITEQKAFHFYVGDIDKRQAKGDLMSEERREAAAALAEAEDTFIYQTILKKGNNTSLSAVASLTTANLMSTLTAGLKILWQNGVPRNEKVFLEASPSFIEKMLLCKVLTDTDNSKLIELGVVGKLKTFNIETYMSNNIPQGASANSEYLFIRTKKAVTFAEQISEIKAYEPQNYFGDAVKGLQVYGAKVIRPKECIVIPITSYGEETNI